MTVNRYGLNVLLCLILTVGTAWACLWDSDTIETELQGVPDRRILVSNRWYRHGLPYYQERIDRLSSKQNKTLVEYDDLAVAFERTQDFNAALTILDEKLGYLDDNPNQEHLYRYHANYGTVLAHSGAYESALLQLEKAIEINPDAHFGREEFQIHLIRFIVATQKDSSLWKTHNFLSFANHPASFETHYRSIFPSYKASWDGEHWGQEEDLEKAYQGISGMLRFGGREGPELYRALGDVSLAQNHLNVAWYCYQIAILKQHPASERIQKTLRDIETHWESSDPRRLPNEDHFEAVYKNSLDWLSAFQGAEKRALTEGLAPGEPETLSRLIAEADLKVPALELAVYGSKSAVLLDTIDPEHQTGYKTKQVVTLLLLSTAVFSLLSWLAFSHLRKRRRDPRQDS